MFVGKAGACPSEAPLSVILLSVAFFTAMLSVFMLSYDMLNVVMLSVIMLNVVMLCRGARRPNKLECYIKLGWKGLQGTNTLAYLTYS
jgi:hypothetical protein